LFRIAVISTAAALLQSPRVHATPTPTPTPAFVVLPGIVLVPGATGLIPVEQVHVQGPMGSALTDAEGQFTLSGYVTPAQDRTVTAIVGDVPLRSVYGAATANFTTIDPVSEAAVRILGLLFDYSRSGLDMVLVAVRQANQETSFAGLGLVEAIDLAESTARDDPNVQAALGAARLTPTPTRTGTPTPTPTPTATVTETFLPTATPRPCVGDCDRGGTVSVDELVRGVNITLAKNVLDDCPSFDGDDDDLVTIDELVTGVENAISGCMPSPPLPDLLPAEVRPPMPPGCGALPPLLVCVANVGQIAAGSFQVSVNGEDAFAVEGLAAGEVQCVARPYIGGGWLVAVDTLDEVVEAREDNNAASFDVPPPPEVATCTPTQTPTPTPSATPT